VAAAGIIIDANMPLQQLLQQGHVASLHSTSQQPKHVLLWLSGSNLQQLLQHRQVPAAACCFIHPSHVLCCCLLGCQSLQQEPHHSCCPGVSPASGHGQMVVPRLQPGHALVGARQELQKLLQACAVAVLDSNMQHLLDLIQLISEVWRCCFEHPCQHSSISCTHGRESAELRCADKALHLTGQQEVLVWVGPILDSVALRLHKLNQQLQVACKAGIWIQQQGRAWAQQAQGLGCAALLQMAPGVPDQRRQRQAVREGAVALPMLRLRLVLALWLLHLLQLVRVRWGGSSLC
jgi:hypothetical protein